MDEILERYIRKLAEVSRENNASAQLMPNALRDLLTEIDDLRTERDEARRIARRLYRENQELETARGIKLLNAVFGYEAEIDKLREALAKYADVGNWIPTPKFSDRNIWLMAWNGDEYSLTPWMIAQDALRERL